MRGDKPPSKRLILFIILIGGIYLLTRLVNIHLMNEYTDYDEGTYLMIARLINHGYLPYKSIFAVHPPLYYYILALWLRIFGDSYVVGRLLSVCLGALSLVVAYFTGKKLLDWRLGTAFATLLALDPLLIYMNAWAYQGTLIELFTLSSLYCFVVYIKEKGLKYAYFSVFLAALGTTVKFTLIPFLVGLYIVLFFHLDKTSWRHLEGATNAITHPRQFFVILLTYIFATVFIVSLVTSWPSELIRSLAILPGIHAITLIGHEYVVSLLILFWLSLTVYLLNLRYIPPLVETIRSLLKKWKYGLRLALVAILAKVLVEVPLGVMVSPNYFDQTYISQSGRYLPLVNVFSFVHKFLANLENSRPELLVYWVPTFLLLAWTLLLYSKEISLRYPSPLKVLFVVCALLYLIAFPIIPEIRFIYPLILVFYILSIYTILRVRLRFKKVLPVILITFLLLSMVDYGLLTNYPEGDLKLAWAPHTNSLREDLSSYIKMYNVTPGTCLSINPMNAYYLGLHVYPYTVDTFGIAYLSGNSASFLLRSAITKNTTCVILSTWMYAIMKEDGKLHRAYFLVENYSNTHGTLLFGESYSDSEIMELFKWNDEHSPLTISVRNGKFILLAEGIEVGSFYLTTHSENLTYFSRMIFDNGTYLLTERAQNGSSLNATAVINGTTVVLMPSHHVMLALEIDGIVLSSNGTPLSKGASINVANMYIGNIHLRVEGSSIKKENKRLMLTGPLVKITLISS